MSVTVIVVKLICKLPIFFSWLKLSKIKQGIDIDFLIPALEKSLVPWIADSEVKFCPICKKQFNVARRRHHCRLCGGIMCAKCSSFASVTFSGKVMFFNNNYLQSTHAKVCGKERNEKIYSSVTVTDDHFVHGKKVYCIACIYVLRSTVFIALFLLVFNFPSFRQIKIHH